MVTCLWHITNCWNLSLAIWALPPVSELVVNTNRSAVTLQFAHRLPHFPDRDTPILQAETHSFTHTRNFQTGVLRQAGAKLWRTLAPQGLSFETPVLDLLKCQGQNNMLYLTQSIAFLGMTLDLRAMQAHFAHCSLDECTTEKGWAVLAKRSIYKLLPHSRSCCWCCTSLGDCTSGFAELALPAVIWQ